MSDFTAKIQAILDTSKIPSQIKSIEKTPIKLSNVKFDRAVLAAEIKSVFKDLKINATVESVDTSKVQATIKNSVEKVLTIDDVGVKNKIRGISADIELLRQKVTKLGDSKISGDFIGIESSFNGLKDSLKNGGQEVNVYKQNIKNLKDEIQNLNKEVRVASGNLKLDTGAKTLSEDSEKMAAALRKVSSLQNDVQKKLSSWGAAKTKAPVDYQELQRVNNELIALSENVGRLTKEQFNAAFSKLSTDADKASANIRTLGADTATLGQRIGAAVKQYAGMFTGAMAIMRLIQYTKQAVSAVVDLDYAMTQLRIVTKATNSEMAEYANTILGVANKTASAVSDMVDATTTFSRLGYTLSESTKLGELTAMLQNVGNIDTTSAQNAMTALIKGFGIDVQNMERVMDDLVTVGNRFPVSVSELAISINNAGSMLHTAGNSYQESLALLTAANTTIQDASRASTGLRTISARLRNTKTELDDLGEAMSMSQYDDLVRGLTSAKVALIDANGEFRSTYDILKDLSGVWENLSTVQQASLAKMIAGTRQQNVLSSILTQFQEAEGAMQAMANSYGALEAANNTYLESIQAHVQQLKNAFDTMFYSDATTDFIIHIVDIGKTLLNIIGSVFKVIDALGGLKTALAAVVAIIVIAKRATIIPSLLKYLGILKDIPMALRSVASGSTSASNAITALGGATNVAKAAFAAFGVALAAVIAIISAVRKAHEDYVNSVYATGDEAKESSDKIVELSLKYEEAKESIKDNIDVSDDFIQAQSDIMSALGMTKDSVTELIDEYGNLDNAIESITLQKLKENLSGLYDAAIVSQREAMSNYGGLLTQNVVGMYNGGILGESEVSKFLQENGYNVQDYFDYQGTGNRVFTIEVPHIEISNNIDDYYKAVENLKYLRNIRQTIQEQVPGWENDPIYRAISESIAKQEEYLKGVSERIDSANKLAAEIIFKEFDFEAKDLEEYKQNKKELIDAIESSNQWNEAGETSADFFATQLLSERKEWAVFEVQLQNETQEAKAAEAKVKKLQDIRKQILDRFFASGEWSSVSEAKRAVNSLTEEELLAAETLLNNESATSGLIDSFESFGALCDSIPEVIEKANEASKRIISFTETISSIKDMVGSDNVVDILFRPKVDTAALTAAGWDVSDNDIPEMFARTFANKDDTVAINFTPVVLDEYGNVKDILSPNALEIYARDVLSGVREDDLHLQIGTVLEVDDNAYNEQAARLETLKQLYSDFDVEFDGSKYEPLIKTLTAVDSATQSASRALQELNNELKEPSYGEGLEARASNYVKMVEAYKEGEIGDTAFRAYAKYFGIALENADGTFKTYEEIGEELKKLERYTGAYYDEQGKLQTDADQGMLNWLEDVEKLSDGLLSYDGELKKLEFDPAILFDENKMEEMTSRFGVTSEFFIDLLNNFRKFSLDWQNFSDDDLREGLETAGIIDDINGKTALHVKELENLLNALGLDYESIQKIVQQAKDLDANDIEIGIDIDPSIKNNPQAIADKVNEVLAQAEGGIADNLDIVAELISDLEPEVQAKVKTILAEGNTDLEEQIQAAIDEQSVTVNAGAEIDEGDSLNTAAGALSESFDKGNETADKLNDAAKNIANAGVEIAKLASNSASEAALGEKSTFKIDVGTGPAIKALQEFRNQYKALVAEINGKKVVINVSGDQASEANEDMEGIVSAIITIDGEPPITIEVDETKLEDPKELLDQIKTILSEEYGINLNDDEAEKILDELIAKITKKETKEVEVSYSYENDINAPENQGALSNSQGIVTEPQYIEGDASTYGIYEPKVVPVADENALDNLTKDVEEAVENADTDVSVNASATVDESDISLPGLSDLPKVPAFKMNKIDTSDSQKDMSQLSETIKEVSNQKVEYKNKTDGIDKVASAASKSSDSLDRTSSSAGRLSGTSIITSNKTSPLSALSSVAQGVTSVFERLLSTIVRINNTPVQIKTVNTSVKGLAKGTKKASKGLALLGDEYSPSGQPKPELVVSDGHAYLAGVNGPTLANLKSGDVVYTNSDTKHILSDNPSFSNSIPAFAQVKDVDALGIKKGTYKTREREYAGGTASNFGNVSNTVYNDNSTNSYNYNAGSGDSSTADTAEESTRDFVDWIEILIDRTEIAINRVKNIAESAFKSLTTRLSSTKKEIELITEEIDIQRRAYDRYVQQAESVGLSSDLAKLVRDGKIDIEEYDEETRKLIDDYQNWYEKALNCSDAIDELHENLSALYQDNFENIHTDYENQLERFSFLTNEYNNYGRVISREHNQNIDTLRDELKDLEKAFSEAMSSGEIQSKSEAWYGMVNTIQDVRDQISEMYEQVFSDIQSNYDNQISILDHFKNSYENAMDQMEAKGRLASTHFYSALSDIEKQNVGLMQKELSRLESTLSEAVKKGEIETYSEAWYSMRKEIDGVKESIEDANLQLLEYAKSMRELDWSHFDYMQDRISKLNEEAEFLINLMSNDNLYQDSGQFNREGLATLGLRVQNYDVDMAQADAYAAEIKKVNKEIAKDKYNTELIERREELLNLQRESILSAESEKNAIKDLVEEGIKIELDNLKELIDTYKESIDSAKDLYEYNKNIAAQTKNIASLEKQLNAYQNDTSEETRTKVQKLRVELDDARQKLQETQYDRFVSDSKKMLDNLYDEYSDLLNSRLDDIDQLVLDMIDTVNTNSYDIKSTLYEVSDDVGYTMTTELKNVWNSANAIATYYGENFTGQLTTVNNTLNNIRTFVEALVKNSDKEADRYISETASSTATTDNATASGGSQRTMTTTPSASSASSSTLSLSRNLSYGSKGDDVKKLQQRLYDLGYLNAAPDGIFGSYTLAAVNAFQMANGIGVDGIVGPKTLEKLNGSPIKKQNAKSTTFNYSKNLSYNSKGSDVTQLQKRLAELGYYAGYIDGNFGSQTLQAVKDFQKANGIYVDGIVGKTTTKYLNGNPKLGKYMRYATGGLVTSTGMAHLDGTPQKPELVLNAEDTRNFIALKDILSDMSSPLRLASISNFSHLLGGGLASGIGNVINGGINIRIDHVEDYNDFVNQLRQDHQFERLIQSMTTDRIAGRSSLNKNNYRW